MKRHSIHDQLERLTILTLSLEQELGRGDQAAVTMLLAERDRLITELEQRRSELNGNAAQLRQVVELEDQVMARVDSMARNIRGRLIERSMASKARDLYSRIADPGPQELEQTG
jgi:hypothetical protein